MGDERGVSGTTVVSLQFPAMHYFALFIAKCLLATEKVGSLIAPDFIVLCRALYGNNTHSLGATVARRLHLNRFMGKIHGGIYDTRLATHFNVQIRQHDHPLPKAYLDREAMKDHQFIVADYPNIDMPYNLVFSEKTRDIIPLHVPALFDQVARGGYKIMHEDIVAYRSNLSAAQAEPQ